MKRIMNSNMPLPFEDEITAGDVRVDWERILPGLLEVKENAKADWRPEDIYTMCRNQEAHLFLFDGGFVICGREQNRFTLAIELFLYVVYSNRRDSCAKFLPYFEGLARQIGATSLTMQSPRGVFESFGWEVEQICYKRSL